MCQFCLKHGEGKKWYFQMKNYAEELLHEELTALQKELVGAATRIEDRQNVFKRSVLPACGRTKSNLNQIVHPNPTASEEYILENLQIKHFGQVIPIEDAEKIIDMVDSITRMPCGCRYTTTGKTDKRYCFGLGFDKWGILGKFPDAASSLEVLNKKEAKKILRQYDQEGLIHSIWTGVTPYVEGLCNCDRDCLPVKEYFIERGTPQFFRAEYICQVDSDLCTGCKGCVRQCQFGAMSYSSVQKKVYIDPKRCFGCGVCRAACSQDAICLIDRHQNSEVAELWLDK